MNPQNAPVSASPHAAMLLRQAFPVLQGAAMARFWENSVRVAGLTAKVAIALRVAEPGSAYTFGLFRDCGMPVLLCKHAEDEKIMADAAFGNAFNLACAQLGVLPAQLGALGIDAT